MANVENLQSINNLLEAVDIIASSRAVPQKQEGQIIKATIINNDRAYDGLYSIEDSVGIRYQNAQSTNYSYQVDDVIYALVPTANSTKDIIIIGKAAIEKQQYGSISVETKADFLAMDQIAVGSAIWPQTPPTKTTVSIPVQDDLSTVLTKLNTYDRLLLDVNITTTSGNINESPKQYQFILTVKSRDTIDDDNTQQEITHTFSFGSRDIFGDPYNLIESAQAAVFNLEELGEVLSFSLELEGDAGLNLQVNDIQLRVGYSTSQIQQAGIVVSTSGLPTWTSEDTIEQRQRELTAHIFWPAINGTIMQNYNLSDIPAGYLVKVLKYDATSTVIDPIAGEHWVEEASASIADLLIANEPINGIALCQQTDFVPRIIYTTNALPLELQGVSYQIVLTYETNGTNVMLDNIGSFMTTYNTECTTLFGVISLPIVLDNQTFNSRQTLLQYLLSQKYLNDLNPTDEDQTALWGGNNETNIELLSNVWTLWQQYYPILQSNILDFKQTNFDPLLITKTTVDNVFVSVDTGYSGGIFNNYYSNDVLINSKEKDIRRSIDLSYRTFRNDYYTTDDYDVVAWYFPLELTMIHTPEKNIEYQLAVLDDDEAYADRYKTVKVNYSANTDNNDDDDGNTWIFEQISNIPPGRYGKITRYAIENDDLGGNDLYCYRTSNQIFRINDIYNNQFVNNSIYCVVQQKNRIVMVREIPLTFNSTGGQGLDVTFKLEMHKSTVRLNVTGNKPTIQKVDVGSKLATMAPLHKIMNPPVSIAIVPKIINEERHELTNQEIARQTITFSVYLLNAQTNKWEWQELGFSGMGASQVLQFYDTGTMKAYAYLTHENTLVLIWYSTSYSSSNQKYWEHFTVKAIVSNWQTPMRYNRDGHGLIVTTAITESMPEQETFKTVDLTNYCPIPCALASRNSSPICQGLYGTNIIKYSTSGNVLPEYANNSYTLFQPINDTDFLSQVRFQIKKSDGNTIQFELNQTFNAANELNNDTFTIYSLQIVSKNNANYIWFSFPILVFTDLYESEILNNWDGKFTVNSSGSSYILASMLGAGVKDSNNTFTGINLGKLVLNNNELPIGLYGFQNGDLTFGFKTDGTAFIGKASGSGSIVFNGTKSIIQSNNYTPETSGTPSTGTLIDLQNGYISLGGKLKIDGKKSILHSSNWNGSIQYNSNGDVIQFIPGTRGSVLELQTGLFSFGGGNLTFYKNESTHENELIVQGTIKAGHIGGWVIDEHRLYSKVENADFYTGINQVGYGSAFYAKANDYTGTGAVFSVDHDGTLYASQGTLGSFAVSEDGLSCTQPIYYYAVDRAFGIPADQEYYESIQQIGYQKTNDISPQSGKSYYKFGPTFKAITTYSGDNPAELGLYYRTDPNVASYTPAKEEAIISGRQYYQSQKYIYSYTGNTPKQDQAYESIPASSTEGYRRTQDPGILANKTYYARQPQLEFYYNSNEAILNYDAALKILQTGLSSHTIFQVSPQGTVTAMKGRYEAASLIVTNQQSLKSNSIISTNASSTKGKAAKFRAIAIADSNGQQYSGVVQMSGAGNFGLYSDTHSRWILFLHREGSTLTLGDPNNNHAAIDFYYADTSVAGLYPHVNKSIDLGYPNYRWNHIYGNTLYNSSGSVSSSDKKIKNHIQYLNDNNLLEQFMMDLKPAMYTLSYGTGHRHHMGLYAQDVSATAHNTIGDIAAYKATVNSPDTEETYYNPDIDDQFLEWGLDYNELLAPTIALLQKTTIKVKKLEQEIEQLKQQTD